jgi:hypothetical protein
MQCQLAGRVSPVRLQHALFSSQVKIAAIFLDSVCIPMEGSWSMARLGYVPKRRYMTWFTHVVHYQTVNFVQKDSD